jgi:protein-S-isoprenylcysteine O-methyltransferase Ste14
MHGSSGSDSGRGEGWVVAQALLLAALVIAGVVAPSWDGIAPWLGIPAGALLIALGGTLALVGARGLGRSLTAFPRPRPGAELVSRGIYARVRHPIYGGLILAAPGWALLTSSIAALVLAGVLAVFLVVKSRREEAYLAEVYPGYDAYRRRTPRRFFPYLV